jgi:4-hydroxybenzoate polyprenyltransferase
LDAARGGTLRAWGQLLRAPLLLTPAADVLAGWSVAFGEGIGYGRAFAGLTSDAEARAYDTPGIALAGWDVLLRTVLVGTCLLAAGMAQNGVADAAEDRRAKPDRPIPRGAVGPVAAHAAWVGLTLAALALASSLGREVLLAAGAIAVLTAAYHLGLKRTRVAGCLVLGAARGLDLALGGLALVNASRAAPAGSPLALLARSNLDDFQLVVPAYAAYVACASLHASTDDEPPAGRVWSRLGLGGAALVLAGFAALAAHALSRGGLDHPLRLLAPVLLLVALARLLRAWRLRPPPAVTGVALSNLYLFDAAVASLVAHVPFGPGAAGLILLLFAASRLLLRTFPPT